MYSDETSGGTSLATSNAPADRKDKAPNRPVRPLADMPSPTAQKAEGEAEGRGHFFGLHFPTFVRACQLGINHAVTYLILARGTQADNRTTTWSTNSVESHTRLSRIKARACISEMIESKLIEHVGGTKNRPVRTLFPSPVPKSVNANGDTLDDESEAIMRDLPLRDAGRTETLISKLTEMAKDGWVEEIDGQWHTSKDVMITRPKTELTWLPNSLVDGLEGRVPPIEILRQTQCPWTLCLLVALYSHQELTFSQGISHSVLYEKYTRKKLGEFREFDHYEFTRDDTTVSEFAKIVHLFENSPSGRPLAEQFFEAIDLLCRLGLVSFIPHLFDGPDGEVMFPLVHRRDGADCTAAEGELFDAVQAASKALEPFDPYSSPKGDSDANEVIGVLIQNHMKKVQVRGIARLRHRPRTTVTANWLAQSERWKEWADFYQNLNREIRLSKVRA